MKHLFVMSLIAVTMTFSTVSCFAQLTEDMKKDGWVSIFDGKTLDGWKSNEKYEGFEVKDGEIFGKGNRNHLYFMEELKNFELKLDCKISKGGNAGVYVKSQWQDESWPVTGFELQVNSSHKDPVKTGSLYNIIKIFEAPHADDAWFTYHIICKGNNLTVKVFSDPKDEKPALEYIYVDPMEKGGSPVTGPITDQNKRISQKGHIALQQHDPESIPQFRNIFLKKLAD
ncbi:MAG: 3-keto-disaccharide hydrolase [Thermoguttaceae bacterium]